MSKGRRAKPYKKGPRKQMTEAWKRLVLARLDANEKAGKGPSNLAQLADVVGADKRGMYVTFDLKADAPQNASVYVDPICHELEIPPPMIEASEDSDIAQAVEILRALDPDARRDWINLAKRMAKR